MFHQENLTLPTIRQALNVALAVSAPFFLPQSPLGFLKPSRRILQCIRTSRRGGRGRYEQRSLPPHSVDDPAFDRTFLENTRS